MCFDYYNDMPNIINYFCMCVKNVTLLQPPIKSKIMLLWVSYFIKLRIDVFFYFLLTLILNQQLRVSNLL